MSASGDEPTPGRRASAGPKRSRASAEAILDAAEALLAEAGYAGFSIEQVARRAGAGKPTIYRWWNGKAALLLDVYSRQKPSLPTQETGTLEGDLVASVRTLFRFWRETPAGGAFRSVIAEAQSDPGALAALHRFLDERRDLIAVVFRKAQARGELAADFEATAALDLVTGYVWQRLLVERIADDVPAITAAMRLIAAGALRQT